MASLMFAAVGLLGICAFSVLEARAEEVLRSKCKRKESLRPTQQEITVGKRYMR